MDTFYEFQIKIIVDYLQNYVKQIISLIHIN